MDNDNFKVVGNYIKINNLAKYILNRQIIIIIIFIVKSSIS